MSFTFFSILPATDPVYGFILLILATLFLTLLKIAQTVQSMRSSSAGPAFCADDIQNGFLRTVENPELFPENETIIFQRHTPAATESGQNRHQPGISLDDVSDHHESIASGNAMGQKTAANRLADGSGSLQDETETIAFADAISYIQSEIENDPEIRDFSLFTNPQHIFSGALKEIFAKKVAQVLHQMDDFRFKVYPFHKIVDSQIYRLHLDEKQNVLIEELFELWRMGYTHPALPELFVHYFFAIGSDSAPKILKSIILNKVLEKKQLKRICFLYQDVLDQKILLSDLREEAPAGISNAFELSNAVAAKKLYLTRKVWNNWVEIFFGDLPDDRKGVFYLFFLELLGGRVSFILHYSLIKTYKHILNIQWREFIERQAFYHGHYEKCNFLAFVPPEYFILISKTATDSEHTLKDLLSLVHSKAFWPLHTFLIHQVHQSEELAAYEIDPKYLMELLQNLDCRHDETNYVPQAIRFLLFLYYYEKKDLQKINYISPYLRGRIGKFIPRLYQVRLLFKRKEFERAYHEINDLWNNDEENMLLMNEVAIYAYHSDRIKEAEELFSRLRSRYPDNVHVLHNEAVFLQHKARLLTETRKRHDVEFMDETLRS